MLYRNWLAVFIIGSSLHLVALCVNLQVPLYSLYAQKGGYGVGATTVMFACYVVVLMPMLIFLGGFSERSGRKPPMLLGLLFAILATLVVILFPSFESLIIARVFQGIAIALCAGAATAYLAETIPSSDASRWAAAIVTTATSLGFGGGPLLTGVALFSGLTPVPWSYWVYLLITVPFFVALFFVGETKVAVSVSWTRLPHFPAGTMVYGMALMAAWAVSGMVLAVVPRELARHELLAWSGIAVFLINAVGVACQPLAVRMDSRFAVRLGLILASLGYAVVVAGAILGNFILVLLGPTVAGAACYGLIYLGGLAAVSTAAKDKRAQAASGFFLFGYVGLSLPVVVIGYLADLFGLQAALIAFGGMIAVFNTLLWWLLRRSE